MQPHLQEGWRQLMYERVQRNKEEMGEGGSCMQLGRFADSLPTIVGIFLYLEIF